MLIVLIFAAFFGSVLTAAALWPFGIITALAVAPFGGSAATLLAALILYDRDPPSWQQSPTPQRPLRQLRAILSPA